jgi:hypothetical protein
VGHSPGFHSARFLIFLCCNRITAISHNIHHLNLGVSFTMASPLDFEALLSREYRPARVTRLVPREAYHPEKADKKKKNPNSKPTNSEEEVQRLAEEETSRLVLSLVTHTPDFTKHIPSGATRDGSDLLTKQPLPRIERLEKLPAPFHQVELDDWEKKINWEGYRENKVNEGQQQKEKKIDPQALLRRPRNAFLDNISFDEMTVSWEGSSGDLMEKARRAPLILELGVAGRSVARHVYQNTVLSAQRPTPALKSEAYQMRMEKDWLQPVTSTADVIKGGSLHADKKKMEALIAARQQKRAEMAEDKTSRVIEALGTLSLGGGKGRTITSSLMGPGGTERTGRPSRLMSSSVSHDTEYVEQLDMVNSHAMVRDLSKLLLREYHRPKIPLNIVRQDLAWQFQIRYIPTGKKTDAPGNSSSYQAIMSGTHAGAVSKAKLRTEVDLSPAEGKLVMLEYSEERTPVQLTKGMACKIVNYFRGDKARCPVSAGGGDRPARRKRAGEGAAGKDIVQAGKSGRPPRLEGPNRPTTLVDWIGKIPERSQKERAEKEIIDILPEGITETLYNKVHGPFIGEVEEGTVVTGLISNLFVAPMFRQEPETTDFLMILTPPGGVSRPGERESMGVIIRDLPSSVYTVGQTEPRTRVWAPNTQGEKNFVGPFVSYQIAKVLTRSQAREGHGMRFDELQDRVLPNLELPANALRQRLKQVALYDKNTMIWTTKAIGYEDYPGVDALAKSIAPEGVAAFETACAAARHLADVGIHHLSQSHTVASVAVTMVYLSGQLNAARDLFRKTKKLGEISRTNKSIQPIMTVFYEKAAGELEAYFKMLRQKHEICKFIYEELQLAPWHLTGEFIEVHKKAEGSGMMKLTGLGDPSGQGEGFSFLREIDLKPTKSDAGALSAQMKKITGTDDDLRKLTMKQMASLLRSYGMAQKQIDTLKRWDRVHVIRDLSTKAASDGIGDGLERFARGEKMKLSEQKKMYRDRIQVIWRRQITALSMEGTDRANAGGTDGDMPGADGEGETAANAQAAQLKGTPDKDKDNSDSESDDDDDDLAAAMEEEMMDRSETNQLVAAHAREQEGDGGLGQLRAAAQDNDLSKDARELAALKRQREEERAAHEGLQSAKPSKEMLMTSSAVTNRKVIRKRTTKTHPDGKQTTTFKFVLHPEEVGKILSRLQQQTDDDRPRTRELTYEHGSDEKPPGHAMFEDADDFEYSSRGRLHTHKRRGGSRRRGGTGGRGTPRARNLQLGKLKPKVNKEERIKKRKREEEELEVYATSAKRKGTNNRRERGSIRDRRPHVIFAEKLEAVRSAIESRPYAGPFVKPVNSRLIPRYYEVISHPIDLQTIRDKISRYEYRTADAMVRDFELMKSNAIKFNGQASPITQEAISIFDYVQDQVNASRDELTQLEVAVNEQMSGKPKKKQGGTKKSAVASSNVGMVGGVQVNLGNFKFDGMDGIESDSDDSFTGLLDL